MKKTIKVEITNIKVDTYYYSFHYRIEMSGKVLGDDDYEGDHAWNSPEGQKLFKKLLRDGYAIELALGIIKFG